MEKPVVNKKIGKSVLDASLNGEQGWVVTTQLIFTCSKSTIETLEKSLNYVQH